MPDAVIVEAVRTPVGKRNGGLSRIHPVDLSARILSAVVERAAIDPAEIDDVYWGCVTQIGDQAANIARNAILAAGWPELVPGVTIDRQCGSSQQAVHFAAAAVASGQCDFVVAGGVESMSRVPIGSNSEAGSGSPTSPDVARRYPEATFHQGIAAEMIAERWGLSRRQLDEYSLASHRKAAAAQDEGAFSDEVIPIQTEMGLISRDEGIRRDTDLEGLSRLKPAFSPHGVVTAGSSSQISDGAAAILIANRERACAAGMRPIARVHSAVVIGSDPVIMLTAPIQATERVLRRSGLSSDDIGLFEVNEAFAAVVLAWLADTQIDPMLVNPLGGAIALGHPLGATGARLMTTLVHHQYAHGIRYGLQTMCEGGGMANATILELL